MAFDQLMVDEVAVSPAQQPPTGVSVQVSCHRICAGRSEMRYGEPCVLKIVKSTGSQVSG